MALTKTEKYIKKYRGNSDAVLEYEKIAALETMRACREYIESAHDTFLGPLAAHVTYKDCLSKIEAINTIIKSRIKRD